ncbi:MAG: hypothetical protein KatS3mg049_2408 [Caldilinea sp.]|jgi:hypothetical protein|nr:MAG: hypothetical protein KatS3mg049_2408 [Caldilinea sp.]
MSKSQALVMMKRRYNNDRSIERSIDLHHCHEILQHAHRIDLDLHQIASS